jgi:hypothetical protein
MKPTKALKVPTEMIGAPYYNRDLKLNGLAIVESFTHSNRIHGVMFLQDHMLMMVLEGTNRVTYGNTEFAVTKNEMVVFKKAIQFSYDKTGNPIKATFTAACCSF